MDFQTVASRQRVALVACPLASRNTIPLALPSIAAYAELHGYPVACWDLNLEFQEILHARGVPADFWNVLNWYGLESERECIMEELADEWAAIILRDAPTVVGFSVTAVSAAVSLIVAKAVKRLDPTVKTVFGGPECIVGWPRFIAKKSVDFVVVGEGEQPFVELLQALDQGREQIDMPAVVTKQSNGAAPQNAVNHNLDALPYPAFSKMALARYARNGRLELPILGSVGCVQNCTFCSRHFLHGGFRCQVPAAHRRRTAAQHCDLRRP
ncbi:MAG: cobalamin-dependent protein [Tetrasphaera sp.]